MSVDLRFAQEVSKYSARHTYGVRRSEPDQDELLKLLNKQMILFVLSDPACLEELMTDEIATLEGVLILKS